MKASSADIELSKYWALLSTDQKKWLLEVIKSFIQPEEETGLQLQEQEATYETDNSTISKIILSLNEQQKQALLSFLQSLQIELVAESISIEQYNKEIEEAEAEFERGEFVSHEAVKAMTTKWVYGK